MKSRLAGKNISPVEVTNISSLGVWLIFNEKEYFLPYREFPWFKEAKVADVLNVKILHDTHLYWPSLDIDLSAEILENLQKYPLVFH